jgi:hypothetical protein
VKGGPIVATAFGPLGSVSSARGGAPDRRRSRLASGRCASPDDRRPCRDDEAYQILRRGDRIILPPTGDPQSGVAFSTWDDAEPALRRFCRAARKGRARGRDWVATEVALVHRPDNSYNPRAVSVAAPAAFGGDVHARHLGYLFDHYLRAVGMTLIPELRPGAATRQRGAGDRVHCPGVGTRGRRPGPAGRAHPRGGHRRPPRRHHRAADTLCRATAPASGADRHRARRRPTTPASGRGHRAGAHLPARVRGSVGTGRHGHALLAAAGAGRAPGAHRLRPRHRPHPRHRRPRTSVPQRRTSARPGAAAGARSRRQRRPSTAAGRVRPAGSGGLARGLAARGRPQPVDALVPGPSRAAAADPAGAGVGDHGRDLQPHHAHSVGGRLPAVSALPCLRRTPRPGRRPRRPAAVAVEPRGRDPPHRSQGRLAAGPRPLLRPGRAATTRGSRTPAHRDTARRGRRRLGTRDGASANRG